MDSQRLAALLNEKKVLRMDSASTNANNTARLKEIEAELESIQPAK